MTIKAIFFDVGGVLVRTFDRQPRTRLAERLGSSYAGLEAWVWEGERGTLAQEGVVHEEDQWRFVCRQLGLPEEQWQEFKAEFFAGDQVDTALVDAIRGMRRRGFRTGVISNAMDGLRQYLVSEVGIADAFDTLTVSAEVGVKKPAQRIFQVALQSLGVQPEEAVFLDDFAVNVTAARALGMQAIHFLTPAQALTELETLLANDRGDHA